MVVDKYCIPTCSRGADLSASLSDLGQWISVLGERANASAAATAGFKQAIGFAFGRGCFYGHGVRVSDGNARFAVTRYAVKQIRARTKFAP